MSPRPKAPFAELQNRQRIMIEGPVPNAIRLVYNLILRTGFGVF
jgi:hypothetical protein